jgi:hypothetical protein
MSDFFSNLLLRSNAPTSGAVLQPRLPSLFESPAGAEQLSAPASAVVTNDTLTPETSPSPLEPARQQEAIPEDKPAREISRQPLEQPRAQAVFKGNTAVINPEKDLGLAQGEALAQPGPAVPAKNQPGALSAVIPLPANQKHAPVLQRDERIAPHKTTFNAPTVSQTGEISGSQKEGRSRQPADRLADDESRSVQAAVQKQPGKNAPQLAAQSTVSASPHKPVLTPQTVGAPVHKNGPQPELPAQNETVVQVHIGRIEVRAVTPSAALPQPARRSAPENPKMSLEDYLHQREKKQ